MILKRVLRMQSKQWSFVIFKIQELKNTVFNDVIENRKSEISTPLYILTKSQLIN